MKTFVRGLLVAFVGLVLVACGNGGETGDSAAGGEGSSGDTLYVGMEAAYPPYNWTQTDDSNNALPIQNSNEFANGYDVQIAQRIGEELGRPVEVVKTDWSGLVPALQSDKIDVIIAGMTPTTERAEAIEFTDSYYDVQFTMVVKKGSQYENATTLEDFENARITAQQGTLHYDVINQVPNADIQQAMTDFSAMRVALQSDKLDAYVSEYPEAISATNAIEDLTFTVPEPSFEMPEGTADYLGIGVKKGNTELVDQINEILVGISDEERTEIMDQAIANQPSEQ